MSGVRNIVYWLWGFAFGSSVWLAVFFSIGFVLPATILGVVAFIALIVWLMSNWGKE